MVVSVRRLLGDLSVHSARPRASYRTDLVTAVLGVWFSIGLFVDAWAHNNLSELETFFTPWHGVFYSGFVATAAWICWSVVKQLLAGRRGLAAVPMGYGPAVVGIPLFAASGAGDYLWHTAFGIETTLDILFSPTHLGLVAGMVLIVSCPLGSAWSDPATGAAPSLRRLVPALLGLSFAASLVLVLTQYANALVWSPFSIVAALSKVNGFAPGPGPTPEELVSAVAVTNVFLLFPLLLLARRWRPPVGTATFLYTAVAGLAGAITEFRAPEMLLMIIAAGVAADALAAWLRPGPGRTVGVLAFAASASLVTWALYVGVASASQGRLPEVVEFWTGMPVAMALHGLLLALLARPYAVPSAPADPPEPVGGPVADERRPEPVPA